MIRRNDPFAISLAARMTSLKHLRWQIPQTTFALLCLGLFWLMNR